MPRQLLCFRAFLKEISRKQKHPSYAGRVVRALIGAVAYWSNSTTRQSVRISRPTAAPQGLTRCPVFEQVLHSVLSINNSKFRSTILKGLGKMQTATVHHTGILQLQVNINPHAYLFKKFRDSLCARTPDGTPSTDASSISSSRPYPASPATVPTFFLRPDFESLSVFHFLHSASLIRHAKLFFRSRKSMEMSRKPIIVPRAGMVPRSGCRKRTFLCSTAQHEAPPSPPDLNHCTSPPAPAPPAPQRVKRARINRTTRSQDPFPADTPPPSNAAFSSPPPAAPGTPSWPETSAVATPPIVTGKLKKVTLRFHPCNLSALRKRDGLTKIPCSPQRPGSAFNPTQLLSDATVDSEPVSYLTISKLFGMLCEISEAFCPQYGYFVPRCRLPGRPGRDSTHFCAGRSDFLQWQFRHLSLLRRATLSLPQSNTLQP